MGILFQRRVAFWCISHRHRQQLRGSEQNVIHVNTTFLRILKFNQSEKSYRLWCLELWRHGTAFSQHFLRIHSVPLNRWHRDDKWILGGELEIKRDQRQKENREWETKMGNYYRLHSELMKLIFTTNIDWLKGKRNKRNFYLHQAISPWPNRSVIWLLDLGYLLSPIFLGARFYLFLIISGSRFAWKPL